MAIMDYSILSYHAWKGEGDKDLHLAAATNAFMVMEFDIRMTKEQSMIFMQTPEAEMLHKAAEEDMAAKAAPPRPRVAPPPRGTMFLSNDELIALEAYRKYKTYMSLKDYDDIK